MLRALSVIFLVTGFLSACTTELDPEVASTAVGEFRLDRVVVVVDQPTIGPLSRKASDGEIETAVSDALMTRFSRFDGARPFSIGVKVQGYVLAVPGIPVVAAPRSMLFVSVNVYDDVPRRLNRKPKNMTIFEDAGGDTVVGSGYTQSAEEQLSELAENASIEIERWLRDNRDWFVSQALAPVEEGSAVTIEGETVPES